jgi:hypothetical protein
MINKDDKPQQKYNLKRKREGVFIINNDHINKDLTQSIPSVHYEGQHLKL